MTIGRPKINVEPKQLRKLTEIRCSLAEIAYYFDCSQDTIERRCKAFFGITFAELKKQSKVGTKLAIKKQLFKMAMNGNTTILMKLADNLHIFDEEDKKNSLISETPEEEVERIKEDMTPVKASQLYRKIIKETRE